MCSCRAPRLSRLMPSTYVRAENLRAFAHAELPSTAPYPKLRLDSNVSRAAEHHGLSRVPERLSSYNSPNHRDFSREHLCARARAPLCSMQSTPVLGVDHLEHFCARAQAPFAQSQAPPIADCARVEQLNTLGLCRAPLVSSTACAKHFDRALSSASEHCRALPSTPECV